MSNGKSLFFLLIGSLVAGYIFRGKIMEAWIGMKAQPWIDTFLAAEKKFSLPQNLLFRIAWIESRFDPNAFNKGSGATGMMQIVPKYHPEIANPNDPAQAIPYAAKYLSQLYNQFKSWDKAIASYNWGQGNVQRVIQSYGADWRKHLPEETKNYLVQMEQAVNISGA